MSEAFLQFVSGPKMGQSVPLSRTSPVTFGRKRGDVTLDDPLVSGRHCSVSFNEGSWWVHDLGSTNGTLLDGKMIKSSKLPPGTELTIGGCRLVLYVGEEDPALGSSDPTGAVVQLDIAWLLDEELVELRGSGERTRSPGDIIGQDLRLPPGLNAVIEVVAGQDAGKVFRFTRGNVTMGRRQGEIPLSDVEVSRRHAVIEVFGREMIFLRDLGSTNGTYHNGRRVSVSKLQSGDTVGCGKTVMKLQISR